MTEFLCLGDTLGFQNDAIKEPCWFPQRSFQSNVF